MDDGHRGQVMQLMYASSQKRLVCMSGGRGTDLSMMEVFHVGPFPSEQVIPRHNFAILSAWHGCELHQG